MDEFRLKERLFHIRDKDLRANLLLQCDYCIDNEMSFAQGRKTRLKDTSSYNDFYMKLNEGLYDELLSRIINIKMWSER